MRVTDHALVRYISRRKRADLRELCPCATTDAEKLAALSLLIDVESIRDEIGRYVEGRFGAKAGSCRRDQVRPEWPFRGDVLLR